MTKHIVLLFSLSTVLAHEYYRGSCPVFPPMRDLDWTRLTGDWWTAFKMNSRSSCIRYRYSSENGERKVTERKLLPVLGRFGVPSGVTSSGVITGSGSNMEVEWNTGMIRNLRMNYIILDTDYNSRTLVCSCHDINLGFLSVNRRSCEYLIKPNSTMPMIVPSDYRRMLDSISKDLVLDMKRIRQDDCDDLESLPSLNIGTWWSLARDYGQSFLSLAEEWF